MSVRIGINPLTWTNDDLPTLGANTPLQQCLSEGKQAGYAGFELGQKFPRSVAQLKPIMAEHRLELISGWYSARLLERSADEEIEQLQDHLALLKGMGCEVMVFAEVSGCVHGDMNAPISTRPIMAPDNWSQYGKKITQVAEYLQQQSVRLAYHHHIGTVVETGQEIDYLMQHTGSAVGLLLDTGHLYFAGTDPVDVIARHGQRIAHVHCKDVRAKVHKRVLEKNCSFLNSVLDGVFTVPGDGCIDYAAVLKALKLCDYSGWLVVEAEQDPEKAHPLTYAKLGYEHLSQLVNEIQF